MTVHVSRDYSAAAAGYAAGKFFAAFGYSLAVFLNKILGYSIIGNWGFNIASTARALTISAATNTSPITITTSVAHNLSTGDTVFNTGAIGETNVNGTYMVSVINATQVTLLNSTGNGVYSGSGILNTGFLYATGNPGAGTGASINLTGPTSTYGVSIPLSVRTVSVNDQFKPLILKSSLYPTKNSGIFKIASVDVPNNRYVVDYRSSDTPPPEVGTLTWWLYEIETQVSNYIMNATPSVNAQVNAATNTTPITITTTTALPGFVTGQTLLVTGATGNTGANGTWIVTQVPSANNQYVLNGSVGNGTYTVNSAVVNLASGYFADGYNYNNRIILQSPHASGWQTRISHEPLISGIGPPVAVSVGMGGNSFGDFPIGGVTSYIPLFFNISPPLGAYVNTTTGGGNTTTANRYTFVGDDGGQNVFMYTRSLGAGANGIMSLGIPDNEPVPNAPNTDRAYVYASMQGADFGGIQLRVCQSADIVNGNIGASYHNGLPELLFLTSWSPLEGQHNSSNGIVANSFMYSANASDSPFTSTTEVMPIEVWGGITNDPALNIPQPSAGAVGYGYNQRLMGTASYLRNGRANFGNFALSSDTIALLTVSTTSGSGVSPIQVATTATNALTTGQTVVISGVVGNTAANGTFVITVINNTTFTLNGTTGNGTYVSGGTVNGTPHWLHLQSGIYLLWNGCAGLTP